MKYFPFIKYIFSNIFSNFRNYQLTYISDISNWVIDQEARNITKYLNDLCLIKSRISPVPIFLNNQIIHFGSDNIFFSKIGRFTGLNKNIILTWFHVEHGKKRLEFIKDHQKFFKFIHTSSIHTKNILEKAGIEKEKIVVVPLGVDLQVFYPTSEIEKNRIRKVLGIEKIRIVIGSFQKDGNGWGEGLTPKLIKGPDVFIETIKKLKKYQPLILLTGPARGYVKKRLDEIGIEYIHAFVSSQKEMRKYYQALDLYIVSSRLEGGPKAIVEAMASGIPIVSTRVGMAEDIILDGENGMLSEVEDAEALANNAEKIILNDDFGKLLVRNALVTIKKYDYSVIAKEYFQKMYKKLL